MKLHNKTLRTIVILSAILPPLVFVLACIFFQWYIDSGAKRLLKLEEAQKLSHTYGYVWEQINRNSAMMNNSFGNSGQSKNSASEAANNVLPIPSLSAIAKLNNISSFNKTININDRYGIPLSQLKTTHTCLPLTGFNRLLIDALIAAEDQHFYTRKKGYDFPALLRSTLLAVLHSIRTCTLQYPRGTSTIHMQVARFLLLKYNSNGYTYTERTLARKRLELKLAQALNELYSREEILTVYVNHCVSAGRGMVGYHDISMGLFGVKPEALSEPQSLYLARLVKWNQQVPDKIIRQVKASLPELSSRFKWNTRKLEQLRKQLDTLTFGHPTPVIPANSYLIDLANEYLHTACRLGGMKPEQLRNLNLSDPQSNLRRFGNAAINLTVDYRLQKFLERIVAERGFGPDTTLRTLIHIGSRTTVTKGNRCPPDTIRVQMIIEKDTLFSDSSGGNTRVKKGDTLQSTIRYHQAGTGSIRRTTIYEKEITRRIPGQYHAYAIMNSHTRKLLAYCSKDRLGSRLRSLQVNRTPNGSSVAKPLIYALAYDLDIYQPTDMTADDREIPDSCEWSRSYLYDNGKPVGMIYHNVPEEEGYHVHNHDHVFSGYDFLYNHLAQSNNIIAVETMYRLNADVRKNDTLYQKVNRLLNRLTPGKKTSQHFITGPQLYCAPVSIVRGKHIYTNKRQRNYAMALGTLELSLYEQMHLFNALYDGKLLHAPEHHPSLFIESIHLSYKPLTFEDTVSIVTLFNEPKKIAPVHLALHKRLTSNPADRLNRFDFCGVPPQPPGNFAKSGTTDDVIRPFNVPDNDPARTNYGLWNAIIHIKLNRNNLRNAIKRDDLIDKREKSFINYTAVPETEALDITVACIGECNEHYTGNRDGKSLHGYVSRELLHAFGVVCTSGFYQSYEKELVKSTPDNIKYTADEKSDLPLLSRALVSLQSGIGSKAPVDEIRFEKPLIGKGFRLKGKHYRKMLSFASYTGEYSRTYHKLLKKLRHPKDTKSAREIIGKLSALELTNKALKRDLEEACSSLLESLSGFDDK